MATVTIEMLAETKGINRGIQETNGKLDKFSGGLGKVGTLLKAAFAFQAIKTGIGILGGFVNEAREANKISAQFNATLKSTGNAANINVKALDKMNTKLSMQTGIDDDDIKKNEAFLLTFTNVKNGVGKGNDIFNQATKTILDMSAALGQDGKASSIQLGKALNDPIKGVSALSKVGVSFTADQKAQIKTLVDSGQTMKAQKIILGELNKEFGGSAKAIATPGAKLKVLTGNLKESIGNVMIPLLDKVATFLVNELPPAVDKAKAAFKAFTNSDLFKALVKGIEVAKGAVKAFLGSFSGGGGNSNFASGLISGFTSVVGAVKNLQAKVAPIIAQVVGVIMSKWSEIKPAIASIWANVKSIIVDALSIITSVVRIGTAVITKVWSIFGGTLLSFMSRSLSGVINVIKGVFNIIAGLFKVVSALLHGDWSKAWAGIKQIAKGALQVLKGIVQLGLAALRGIFGLAWNAIKALTKAAWAGIKKIPGLAVAAIKLSIKAQLAAVRAIVTGAWNAVKAVTRAAWNAVKSVVSKGVSGVIGVVRGIKGKIVGALHGAEGILKHIGSQIVDGLAAGIRGSVQKVLGAVKALISHIPAKVRKLLGIHSPSRVMRDLGRQTAAGMALGITQGQPAIDKAMSGIKASTALTTGNTTVKASSTRQQVYVTHVVKVDGGVLPGNEHKVAKEIARVTNAYIAAGGAA